ncbi:Gmad2 immunoglobulin-like domain-containing protein, partial [bacterium]|nr:Gmad2 immunoglobulin-like domain-containing protein [bacterium]
GSSDSSQLKEFCEEVILDCSQKKIDECTDECVVCPSCLECSSISCQTKEHCAKMGISPDWYENIKNKITNFNECVEAGNPVMESYPRQCRAGERNFTENIGNELEKMDLIKINQPRPSQEIKSPLVIEGEARGTWFFEADFPVVLVDWDGLIIANGIASAQEDWMTDNFVKFKAELTFEKPDYKNNGTLILKKDNPSGFPQNDDALEVTVIFK